MPTGAGGCRNNNNTYVWLAATGRSSYTTSFNNEALNTAYSKCTRIIMSPQAAPMPSIQGEAMELFTRVPPLPISSSRGGGSRGSPDGSHAGPAVAFSTKFSGRRPSTTDSNRSISGGLMISQSGGGVAGAHPDITNTNANVVERPRTVRPGSRGEDGDDGRNSGAQEQGRASAVSFVRCLAVS